jgi:hypothetical protein
MLGYFLAFITYDTVTTLNDKAAAKQKQQEKRKKLKELEWRLSRPMTQGHSRGCICRLCVNRRTSATNEHNRLLANV